MKTEFRARPVYLSRDDRIFAHFTTCFLALTLYRFLEKTLENRFTCHKIIQGLRDLNFYKLKNEGYIPAYVSNDFTDLLHEKFQFQTDLQIVSTQEMKKIFKFTKSGKTLLKKREKTNV
jgi:transposase